jgi:hypothetical protein
MIIRKPSLIFLSLFLLTATSASAANFIANNEPNDDCSDGTGGLQSCFDFAADNAQADVIELNAETFTNGPYEYNAAINAEDFPLTIVSVTPGQAIIDGGDAVQGMRLIASGVGDTNTEFIVRGVTFTAGTSGNGGGLQISTVDADATIEDCLFTDNFATIGGGLDAQISASGSVTVRNNSFIGNVTDSFAGGLYLSVTTGTITVENNIIEGNESTTFGGGGLSLESEEIAEIIVANNLIFNNNTNGDGGGLNLEVEDELTPVAITNNTFFNNTSQANGGGIAILLNEDTTVANVYNNIVFGNNATGNGEDIYANEDVGGDDEFGAVALFNNLYTDFFSECQDGGGTCVTEGENVIGQDPLFVDSASGDFHLTADSPAINAGDPAAPDMPSTDFDGNPRPDEPGTNPDIGAFEFQVPDPTPSPTPTPTAGPTPDLSGGGCSLSGGFASLPLPGTGMGLGLLAIGLVRCWRKRA